MVSCTCMGGIGNTLFQVAMLLGYSLKHNVDYCIALENINPHYTNQKPFYFSNIKYCKQGIQQQIYLEKEFTYNELPSVDNVCFQGYWQSERYFLNYRSEILNAFNIPYNFKKDIVSIHVRRVDYLNLPNCHPPITIEYIYRAIDHFKFLGYHKFLIFSDDIDWCYENIKPTTGGIGLQFSQGKTELEDLALASSCEYSIGSNSSFSWWIYYLNQNKNKIGVFPKKENWFGPALPNDVSDLYNPKWILL